MKSFFAKFIFHGTICLLLATILVYGIYVKSTGLIAPDFREIPTNFISNSVCFNSKLDHIKSSPMAPGANCLILGSSISLNNVDAESLSQKNKITVYNLSSWGLKPYQSYQLLKKTHQKFAPKQLIIAFNNTDFGQDNKEISYGTIYDYLFKSSFLSQMSSFFAHFNIQDFLSDWAMRSKFSKRDNVYQSLRFDDHGSILLNAKNFQYAPEIQPLTYRDTTGYANFQAGIDSIATFCADRQIQLLLVYSPWKKEVLTPDKLAQIKAISQKMESRYKEAFLDLSSLPISSNLYVDGGHLYKKGASIVTSKISDYLR